MCINDCNDWSIVRTAKELNHSFIFAEQVVSLLPSVTADLHLPIFCTCLLTPWDCSETIKTIKNMLIVIVIIAIIIIISGLMNHDCGIYLRQYNKFWSQWVECHLRNVDVINDDAAANSFNNSEQRQRYWTFASSSATNYADLAAWDRPLDIQNYCCNSKSRYQQIKMFLQLWGSFRKFRNDIRKKHNSKC